MVSSIEERPFLLLQASSSLFTAWMSSWCSLSIIAFPVFIFSLNSYMIIYILHLFPYNNGFHRDVRACDGHMKNSDWWQDFRRAGIPLLYPHCRMHRRKFLSRHPRVPPVRPRQYRRRSAHPLLARRESLPGHSGRFRQC